MNELFGMFGTLYGALSLFTILFVIVMGFFLMRFFSSRMEEDERKAAKQQRERNANAKA
jgi:uncharacterized membrane protein